MAIACGPVVGFRGQTGDTWHLVVSVAVDDQQPPQNLSYRPAGDGATAQVEPIRLGALAHLTFFAYGFDIQLQPDAGIVEYELADGPRRGRFTVPGRGQDPRVAYASCNGLSNPGELRKLGDKNILWRDLLDKHAEQPFHLLLMGGDQIYADQIWQSVRSLRQLSEQSHARRLRSKPSATTLRQIERFYADTYSERWTEPAVSQALASIPSVMMWDDHDIFDGWGSYSAEQQDSPTFRAIFDAARRAFVLFQLQTDPLHPAWPVLENQSGLSSFRRAGQVGLLVLDLRSERTQAQVVAPDTWNVVFSTLDQERDLRHLIVMSSIPVLHPSMSFVERAFQLIPGQQDLEDDLHDQWLSRGHKAERLRLIHRLFEFAEAQGTRVTILSGDVHVAATGVIESSRRPTNWLNANVINQITSSAIVHPPPPRILRYFLERIGDETEEIDRGIQGQMMTFPSTNFRFIASRNWLSLDFDETERIWVNWFVEGEDMPLTKVVHPCERVAS
ncbi:MAG: alkaline phosphatase family protein [Hyphomicrobiales bacterium]|nr:alkaline phosphatase family protein [Hyphomicrobiales bacterium]